MHKDNFIDDNAIHRKKAPLISEISIHEFTPRFRIKMITIIQL